MEQEAEGRDAPACKGSTWVSVWVSVTFYVGTLFRSTSVFQVVSLVLAIASTVICVRYGWVAHSHPSLFLMVVVMPLTFAVNAAYARREKALEELSLLRSATLSLFLLHRDWKCFLEEEEEDEHLRAVYDVCRRIIREIQGYAATHEAARHHHLKAVYRLHAELSGLNDLLRVAKVPPPMLTRPIHWHHLQIHAFERLRIIIDYRTPAAVRAYTRVFIFALSPLLSPYFAYLSLEYSFWVGLYCCTMVSITFGYLNNVQCMLENPFDGDQDDINLADLDGWLEDSAGWTVRARNPSPPGHVLMANSTFGMENPLLHQTTSSLLNMRHDPHDPSCTCTPDAHTSAAGPGTREPTEVTHDAPTPVGVDTLGPPVSSPVHDDDARKQSSDDDSSPHDVVEPLRCPERQIVTAGEGREGKDVQDPDGPRRSPPGGSHGSSGTSGGVTHKRRKRKKTSPVPPPLSTPPAVAPWADAGTGSRGHAIVRGIPSLPARRVT